MSRAQPGLVSQYAEWPPKGRNPDAAKQNTPKVTSDLPKEASNASSKSKAKPTKAAAKEDNSKASANAAKSETSSWKNILKFKIENLFQVNFNELLNKLVQNYVLTVQIESISHQIRQKR